MSLVADKDSWTPLHAAAFEGNMQALTSAMSDLNVRTREGNTALCLAAQEGKLDVVKWLLENGANPNIHTSIFPPLYCAAQSNFHQICELLLQKGAAVDAKTSNGTTALYVAAQEGCDVTVDVLLKYGADIETRPDFSGATPLIIAAMHNRYRCCEVLLQRGAKINVGTTRSNRTALHGAVSAGHLPVVQLLLAYRADVNAEMLDGSTPLHAVATTAHVNIANLLIQHGAVLKPRRADNKTPLDLALTPAMKAALATKPATTDSYSAPNTANAYVVPVKQHPQAVAPSPAPAPAPAPQQPQRPSISEKQIDDDFKPILDLFKQSGFDSEKAVFFTYQCQQNNFKSDILPQLFVTSRDLLKAKLQMSDVADCVRFESKFIELVMAAEKEKERKNSEAAAIKKPAGTALKVSTPQPKRSGPPKRKVVTTATEKDL